MPDDADFSESEMVSFLKTRSNWGRWGDDDQIGAINLITSEKRIQAASLVRSGRNVSLSRPYPKRRAPENPNPAQHWMRWFNFSSGEGLAVDYYAIYYHGHAATHLDALCHVWTADKLWNGRNSDVLTGNGARWGGVENWSNGIITRGVLLDVPKFRGQPYVTSEKPVTGAELEQIAKAQGISIEPGDAILVHSGREAFNRESGQTWGVADQSNPGLHASCLKPIRNWDVSVLVWDMLDASPSGYEARWTIHLALPSFGVALVDNALLEPLSKICAEEGRYEFMLMLAPLLVVGGTGSPLNPIAMF